jgi:hypothetical protein
MHSAESLGRRTGYAVNSVVLPALIKTHPEIHLKVALAMHRARYKDHGTFGYVDATIAKPELNSYMSGAELHARS